MPLRTAMGRQLRRSIDHQALILSVIEYGASAYRSARKSILDKLNSTSFHIRAVDAAATPNFDYQKIRQYYTPFHSPWIRKMLPLGS
jgi:hypothetical protein